MASAPGWYPDPKSGGQRYFDGTDWTDETAPAPPSPYSSGPPPRYNGPPPPQYPPTKKPDGSAKLILGVGGVLLLIVMIGSIFSGSDDDKKKSDSSASSSTRSAAATATATTSTGPTKPDAVFTTSQGPDGEVVTAEFAIKDSLTEGLIKNSARFETIDVLEYAEKAFPNAAEVNVVGSFPMTDAYGNTSTDVVINLTYLRSTLQQINFAGVDKDKIWEIRDSGFVHPAFQP
jgi:hypothetical protein